MRNRVRSLILFLMVLSCLGVETASAHFPFHPHCFVRPRCAAPVFWGAPCWPHYPVYCLPRVVCAPIYYRPIVYTPIGYPALYAQPVYAQPVFYDPLCWDSFGYRSFGVRVAVQRTQVAAQQPARSTSVQRVVQKSPPRPLTTYSPVWTESAVGLIDDMMERGEWELAHQSLQRMDKIQSPLGHRVLLRQALLELIAARDAIDTQHLNQIMDRFARAAQEGSRFAPEELRGNSLSNYLGRSRLELNPILDALAQRAIQQPDRSGREMLLLSVLLQLDGQTERASLFVQESRTLAARSDAFRWNPILQSLSSDYEPEALLASKD